MKIQTRIFVLAAALAVWGLPGQTADASRHGQRIQLTATEFSFTPSAAQASGETVTFIVTNKGIYPHGLAIEGTQARIDRINPGETARLTVKLPAKKRLQFWCPVRGHRERGMEGRLVVKAAARGAGGYSY